MSTKRPLVLITGASTGLGLVLAKSLIAGDQHNLVLTARQKSLHRFTDEGITESQFVHLRPLDITNKFERLEVILECESKLGGLDILINNAGVALRSVVEDASADDRINLLDVNYISPMRLAALALPSMRARKSGKILNISSAAGLIGMPTMAAYCGSKFALEGATESLWYEVKPWNIHVSLIIPGFIHSDSFNKTLKTTLSNESLHSRGRDPYYNHYTSMEKLIASAMNWTWATPESIAKKIIRVMNSKKPPLRVLATVDAWVLFLFRRFLPRSVYHWFVFLSVSKSKKWGKKTTKIKTKRAS